MITYKTLRRALLGTTVAATMATALTGAASGPVAAAQSARSVAPTQEVVLSVGTGRLIQLSGTMADVFVASDSVADVQVRSANQIFIFGKGAGQTNVYATDRAGRVIYSATVRVGQNLASVDQMLDLAMPEADIRATPMNGLVLLTGSVSQPEDAAEAERLVQAFVGEGTQVLSRLRTATPQQVMLKVTIAEVSRSLLRDVGVNLQTSLPNGTGFGFARGRDFINDAGDIPLIGNSTGIVQLTDVLGGNVTAAIDADETNGLVTILAEPTLTALSGETASFLAGGEFPIPISQGLGAISVEYKNYGVGLAFTPFVLSDGRISMRVRPEVSELSAENSVVLNSTRIPALVTRRTETTVELGSGQSLVISGLLRNLGNNTVSRTPFLGSLPIIGALFRSTNFQRNETELVIVVTPYLVRPVAPSQVTLPTDGFRVANDGERVFLGQSHGGQTGDRRPEPVVGSPRTIAPGVSTSSNTPVPTAPPTVQAQASLPPSRPGQTASAQPGFDFR